MDILKEYKNSPTVKERGPDFHWAKARKVNKKWGGKKVAR